MWEWRTNWTYECALRMEIVHIRGTWCIQNKNKAPQKLLGSEDAEMYVVDDTGFQMDFSSMGWGRNMGTVLMSILAAVLTALIQWLSTREVQFWSMVLEDRWNFTTWWFSYLPCQKCMHIMLFLPLAFQKGPQDTGIIPSRLNKIKADFDHWHWWCGDSSWCCHDPLSPRGGFESSSEDEK